MPRGPPGEVDLNNSRSPGRRLPPHATAIYIYIYIRCMCFFLFIFFTYIYIYLYISRPRIHLYFLLFLHVICTCPERAWPGEGKNCRRHAFIRRTRKNVKYVFSQDIRARKNIYIILYCILCITRKRRPKYHAVYNITHNNIRTGCHRVKGNNSPLFYLFISIENSRIIVIIVQFVVATGVDRSPPPPLPSKIIYLTNHLLTSYTIM